MEDERTEAPQGEASEVNPPPQEPLPTDGLPAGTAAVTGDASNSQETAPAPDASPEQPKEEAPDQPQKEETSQQDAPEQKEEEAALEEPKEQDAPEQPQKEEAAQKEEETAQQEAPEQKEEEAAQVQTEQDAPEQPQKEEAAPEQPQKEEAAQAQEEADVTGSSSLVEEEEAEQEEPGAQEQARPRRKLKNHKTTQSVPPSILKIGNVIAKVSEVLPKLFVSSALIVELQSILKNINAALACASRETSTVSDLRAQFRAEWKRFVDGVDKIVETNEIDNVREFWERQVPSIERTVQRMRGKAELLEKRPKTKQEFEAIDTAFQDATAALSESLGSFRRTLRALHGALESGDRIWKLITANETEMALVKQTSVDYVNAVLVFIGNAESAVSRRKGVKVVCSDALKEINTLFESALREEKKIREVERREADKDKPVKEKKKKITPPATKLQPIPVPKHTAVTRPPLFEERKRVGVLGPSKSPRSPRARSRQSNDSRGSSRNSGRQSPLPTETVQKPISEVKTD